MVAAAFSILAVLAAALAVTLSDMRKVVLLCWTVGMSIGALLLSYGAEYLAMVQWIVTTLAAISFFVFATLFGEFGDSESRGRRGKREKILDALPALLVGGAFLLMLFIALGGATGGLLAPGVGAPQVEGTDLSAVGRALGERHSLSLEVAGFMLLATLIGAGVLGRPEAGEDREEGGVR